MRFAQTVRKKNGFGFFAAWSNSDWPVVTFLVQSRSRMRKPNLKQQGVRIAQRERKRGSVNPTALNSDKKSVFRRKRRWKKSIRMEAWCRTIALIPFRSDQTWICLMIPLARATIGVSRADCPMDPQGLWRWKNNVSCDRSSLRFDSDWVLLWIIYFYIEAINSNGRCKLRSLKLGHCGPGLFFNPTCQKWTLRDKNNPSFAKLPPPKHHRGRKAGKKRRHNWRTFMPYWQHVLYIIVNSNTVFCAWMMHDIRYIQPANVYRLS